MPIQPLLTQGRVHEAALSVSALESATTLGLPASAGFLDGEPLFLADADGAAPEYVGRIVGQGPTSLSVSLPLLRPRAAGAMAWSARSAFGFPCLPERSRSGVRDSGLSLRRGADGRAWALRLGAALERETLRFGALTEADWRALHAWIDDALGGGILPATLVDVGRNCRRVRLAEATLERRAETTGRLTLELPLIIEAEEAWDA